MGRIILTPGGHRHPLEARAPAVRDEATVIIFLAVHSPSTQKSKFFPTPGLRMKCTRPAGAAAYVVHVLEHERELDVVTQRAELGSIIPEARVDFPCRADTRFFFLDTPIREIRLQHAST